MKASSDALYVHILDDLAPFLGSEGSPESNAKQIAASALKGSLLKKFVGSESESRDADAKALELFLKTNEELLDSPREAERLLDQYLLGEVKASLDRFWFKDGYPLVSCLHELYLRGRVGSGSSIGAKGTDFYTKLFSSNLSTTSSLLYDSYRASCQNTILTSDAEKHRYEAYGTKHDVRYNKLLFVPKRNDISRTICVEPNLNMFYQLGLANILEGRLRQVFGLNLSDQPQVNRELAREGSINNTYVTIDLSSASDSLSIGVLRAILPKGLMSWLMALRSPSTLLPDGTLVQLKMVSTMGNGFTFPLETAIFAAVVEAAYKVSGVALIRNSRSYGSTKPGNFAVFGDDIIVREETHRHVMRLLWLLGFKVNDSKTFVEGPFRESCGGDFYKGQNVRGVYIKTLASPQDRYVAINLLNDWSATTGISLWRTIDYLRKTVKAVMVSPLLGLDQGIHVPSTLTSVRKNRNGSFKLLAYFPRKFEVKINDTGSFNGLWLTRTPNPSGLELAFIAGYVRSNAISLRQNEIRYRMKHLVLPVWDSIELVRSYRRFSFTQWETAVWSNWTN